MPAKIFFCYAHTDESLLNKLKAHLKPLERLGLVELWYDRDISAGTDWKGEIDRYLNAAQLILVLVSSDLMASDYINNVELKRALERHKSGEANVIPIILRPAYWQGMLGDLQALPKDGKPISRWPNREEAFSDVAEGIRKVVESGVAHDVISSKKFMNPPHPVEKTSATKEMFPSPAPKAIQQRERAVKDIYELLVQHNISSVALTGIAGVGKTTLATLVYEYAEKQRSVNEGLFTAPACWVDISPTTTLGDIAETILQALGTTIDDFAKLAPLSQATALFDVLRATEDPRLVVLDQFENLLALPEGRTKSDRPGVGEWIDILNKKTCRCKLLLTSRIWPWGTHQFSPPLICMQEWPDEGMKISEGAKLLRTQGVRKTQATVKDLQQAVIKYKRHALSLTLLASILRRDSAIMLKDIFSSETYKSELKQGLASSLLDFIYKHQLDDFQRDLLFAFSVYREAVPLEAVQLIITPYFDDLEKNTYTELKNLLAQSLLEEAGQYRYQIHVIIADYAQDYFVKEHKQAHQDILQAAHSQATRYYLQQLPQHQLSDEEKLSAREVHCITEAGWHLCQAKQWQDAYVLLKDKKIFATLRRQGDNATLLELYELLLPSSDRCYLDRAQQADIYRDIGSVYKTLGKKDHARDYYLLALELYRDIGSKRVDEAMTLAFMGRIEADLAHKKVALDYCEQALIIFRERPEREYRQGEGWVLAELGRIYNALGQKKRALKEYRKALAIMREVEDSQGEGRIWNQLSRVFRALGKMAMAKQCSLRALEILRPVGDYVEIGRTLSNLSRVHCALDEYEEAFKCCDEALKTLRKTEDRTWEGKTLSNLALVYDHRKDDKKALSVYKEALAILEEVNDVGTKAGTLNRLGRFYARRGQPEDALRYYKEAVNLYLNKAEGDKWERGTTLNNIGLLYLANGQYKIAFAYFTLAMSFFEEVGRPNHPTTRDYLAQLCKKMEEGEYHTLLAEVDFRQAVQMVSQTLGFSPF